MRALKPAAYEPDRAFLREGIGRYKSSTAIESALMLADRILGYVPDHGYRWQHDLQTRMSVLCGAGVMPLDVLQRVAEHYALAERQPTLFKVRRSEHMALARHVLHLTKFGKWRPSTRLLISFGQILAEDLGTFAISLLRRLHQDAAERHALRRAAADFISPEKKS